MGDDMSSEKHYVNTQRNRFAIWAWSPIIVLRVSLLATYLGWVYASAVGFLTGIPIFDLTTPEGWTPIWAVILGTSAVIAGIGSISDRWHLVEKWASLFLSAMIFAYVGSLNLVAWLEGDLARQFVGAVAFIASILPVTRFVYLAAQSGKRHVDVEPG